MATPPLNRTAASQHTLRVGGPDSHVHINPESQRRPWRKTRDAPTGSGPERRTPYSQSPRKMSPRGTGAPLALRARPSAAEIYGRSARSVGPQLRPPAARPGFAPEALDTHLQNDPVFVSQLRNPMWKSSRAAAQAEDDAQRDDALKAERERMIRKKANARREKEVATKMAVDLKVATRGGDWSMVQKLLDWRSADEGFKVDVHATEALVSKNDGIAH